MRMSTICRDIALPMAHVVPELFKAITVFSNRVALQSDVINLTADQINTVVLS